VPPLEETDERGQQKGQEQRQGDRDENPLRPIQTADYHHADYRAGQDDQGTLPARGCGYLCHGLKPLGETRGLANDTPALLLAAQRTGVFLATQIQLRRALLAGEDIDLKNKKPTRRNTSVPSRRLTLQPAPHQMGLPFV
jgi:hypothetical protein